MKHTIFIAFIALLANISIGAQNVNPDFDAELAKKLGADDNGMKSYVFVILKTGPVKIEDKEKQTELFKGHMDNINRLVKENKLVVAGPFGKNELTYRGLFIFNVKTVEEARSLCDTDPAIKAGIFEVDLIPWYGSAALGEYIKISEKITKFKF
jgi:uncharacterized protein YciI